MSIMVWGHRGHRHHRHPSYTRPPHENSVAAYAFALRATMGLECDVVQSKQGTPYLIHDTLFDGIVKYEMGHHLDDASRATLGDRLIYQTDDAALGAFRLKDGQPLPRLWDLLAMMPQFPGRVLNLELKGPNTADVAVRTVEKAVQQKLVTPQQIVFSSFNLPALRQLRINTGHRFKIGALFTLVGQPMAQMYPNWPNAEPDAYYIPFDPSVVERSDVREIEPDFFNLERGSVTLGALNVLEHHYPKAKIILWTAGEPHPTENTLLVDTVAELAWTNRLYAVASDFPEWVQKQLIARGVAVKTPPGYF